VSEPTRPGAGWQRIRNSAVWDHVSGIRIHAYGFAKLPNGSIVNAAMWPLSRELDACVRIAGGNRIRGLMVFAKRKAGEL
jgi:hypothetical protein